MRDLLFSLLHHLNIQGPLRKYRIKNKELSVLMLHRISDEFDPLWPPLPLESFKSLMKELSLKFHVVPLEHVDQIDQYPDKPLVALSFDDGYRDFWENALPILIDVGLPAHHNICPGLIDKGIPTWTQILNRFVQCNPGKTLKLPSGNLYKIENKLNQHNLIKIRSELFTVSNEIRNCWIDSLINYIPESRLTALMSWEQIRECAKLGIHIGSHGMNHLNLSNIENRDTLLIEIAESRKRIYEEVGVDPTIFAFPNGLYNATSLEVVRESGYKVALLCDDKAVKVTEDLRKKDFYVFPRINICRANWKEEHLRVLGFHQKLKSWVKRTPYLMEGY